MNDSRKHMIRTRLRESVILKELHLLQSLHSEIIAHDIRHICIWQQTRKHMTDGFSDLCGYFVKTRSLSSSASVSHRRPSISAAASAAHTATTSTADKQKSKFMFDDLDEDDVSVCCVCFDGAYVDKNPIIFCDQCNLGVHRYCYGIRVIPGCDVEWLCEACLWMKQHFPHHRLSDAPVRPQCCLCPIMGGLLKI